MYPKNYQSMVVLVPAFFCGSFNFCGGDLMCVLGWLNHHAMVFDFKERLLHLWGLRLVTLCN